MNGASSSAARRQRTSATLRAIRPSVSNDGAKGVMPPSSNQPRLGFTPTVPQNDAGRITDAAVCVPNAAGTIQSATAAALPLDDPPGVWSGWRGLAVFPGAKYASSVVTVLPSTMAPACFARATQAASRSGLRPRWIGEPSSVGRSAVSIMSLTPSGTPCSSPVAGSRSQAIAARRTASASTQVHAPISFSRASMRDRQASTSSTERSRPARIAAAASTRPSSLAAGAALIAQALKRRARTARAAADRTRRRHALGLRRDRALLGSRAARAPTSTTRVAHRPNSGRVRTNPACACASRRFGNPTASANTGANGGVPSPCASVVMAPNPRMSTSALSPMAPSAATPAGNAMATAGGVALHVCQTFGDDARRMPNSMPLPPAPVTSDAPAISFAASSMHFEAAIHTFRKIPGAAAKNSRHAAASDARQRAIEHSTERHGRDAGAAVAIVATGKSRVGERQHVDRLDLHRLRERIGERAVDPAQLVEHVGAEHADAQRVRIAPIERAPGRPALRAPIANFLETHGARHHIGERNRATRVLRRTQANHAAAQQRPRLVDRARPALEQRRRDRRVQDGRAQARGVADWRSCMQELAVAKRERLAGGRHPPQSGDDVEHPRNGCAIGAAERHDTRRITRPLVRSRSRRTRGTRCSSDRRGSHER